jgi:hypothetical protein
MPALPDTLIVEEWHDPVVAAHGFPANSRYVRWTWSAILGPTATLTLMLLTDLLESCDIVEVRREALARTLGVKRDVLARGLGRLRRFGFLRAGGSTLAIRTHVGPVPESKLDRLSDYGRVLHDQLMAERRPEVA